MDNSVNNSLVVKIAILISSVSYYINTNIFVVILGDIAKSYPGVPSSMIGLIITMPAIFIIPATLISGKLAEYISKKTILLIGFAIFFLSGIASDWVHNIYYLLTMRAIMGISLGLLAPIPSALIAQLYDGGTRASMMGLTKTTGSFFGIALTLIVGFLAAVSWQSVFYLFSLGLIIMILVGMFVPKVPAEKKEKASSDEKLPPLGKNVWILAFSGLVLYMIMTVVQTKFAILILSERMGTTATVGVISAIMGLGVVFGGITFSFLFKKIGRYTAVIALVIACIAYYGLSTTHNIIVLGIAQFCIGFSSIGLMMPFMMTRVSIVAAPARRTLAITIVMTGMYIGQFLTAFFVQFIETIMHNGAPRTALSAVFVGFGICAVVSLVYILMTQEKKKDNGAVSAK